MMNFAHEYNRIDISKFLQSTLLPNDYVPRTEEVYLPKAYSYTKCITRLGICESLELSAFEILHSSVNDARVSLSKEVFEIMRNNFVGRALVLFVPEKDPSNYRFSLIYFDYEINSDKSELSNPRRYSFYLGKGIGVHTPDKYLVNKGRVASFDDLKERFSIEVLTKEFYSELSDWYAWATSDSLVRFPLESGDIENNKKQCIIRLLTRLLFVWFLKQKNLIPSELFDDKNFLESKLLKGFNPHVRAKDSLFKISNVDSIYYKAILQNLFFATLNCPIKNDSTGEYQRVFRSEGQAEDANYLLHYKNKFKDPDLFVSMMNSTVPFLNGGLFDCLDRKSENPPVYIDCFTDDLEVSNQLILPDYLFFGENKANLSVFYQKTEKENVNVRGIIDILKTYNFTIEENTPTDIEVSLDPELLGKVFENLLASYNPETNESARKETGSFYTPREIVQFMVDESLIAYLQKEVPLISEKKLRNLMSYSDKTDDVDVETAKAILKAIYDCKVLDPACGSGAFPMGILQQMVHILNQLDEDNQYWYNLMLETNVLDEQNSSAIGDAEERIERVKDIEENFNESINRPDYARKLYLVENCIYGIDIQPIAVQISKLRFFISLVVEQNATLDPEKNFGIRPLPNLEAKFVAGNTLIDIKKSEATLFTSPAIESKQKEQKEACHRLFRTKTTKAKRKCQEEILSICHTITTLLKAEGILLGNEHAARIESWDMFDQNVSSSFFDPEWMFGIADGFDIVIGNPPYIQLQDNRGALADLYQTCDYKTFRRTGDIYCLFYEKGLNLLKPLGFLSFITSNKWMKSAYGENLREFLSFHSNPLILVDCSGQKIFESATVDVNILITQKAENKKLTKTAQLSKNGRKNLSDYFQQHNSVVVLQNVEPWSILDPISMAIKSKIDSIGTPIKKLGLKISRGIITGYNDAFIISETCRKNVLSKCKSKQEYQMTEELIRPILRGKDVYRYNYKNSNLWLLNIECGTTNKSNTLHVEPEAFFKKTFPTIYNHFLRYENTQSKGKGLINRDDKGDYWWELRSCAYMDDFYKQKIVYREISTKMNACIVESGIFVNNKCYFVIGEHLEYLLCYFNSKIFNQIQLKAFNTTGGKGSTYIQNVSVKIPTESEEQVVKNLYSKLKVTTDSQTKKEMGEKIDFFFYKLFGLNQDEILYLENSPIADDI